MHRFAPMHKALARALLLAAVTLALVVQPVLGGDEDIVQPGDTLWDIAQANRTTVAILAELNGIANPSLIVVGQRIVLHPPTAPASPPAAPAGSTAPTVYVVRSGDTLWGISVQFETTVALLAAANDIANPSLIRPGQVLVIPQDVPVAPTPAPAAPAPPPPAPAPPIVHVVQAGETLWIISARYGVAIDAIVSANGLASASFIRTGQQLVIPGTTTTPAVAGAVTNGSMPPAMAAKVAERAASRALLLAAAAEFGVSGPFVLAVSWHESGWQAGAVSGAGAIGLMQLMPSTADWVADSMLGETNAINDPAWNARAGTRLLAFYLARYQGNEAKTLAAYFQGMTSVETIGILVSTQPYIDSILGLEQIFSR